MNKEFLRGFINQLVKLDYVASYIGEYTADMLDIIVNDRKLNKELDRQ